MPEIFTQENSLREEAGRSPADLLALAAFVIYCIVIAWLRFAALKDGGAPSGPDAGNWLAVGHRLLGERIISASIAYPPVIPIALVGAVAVFGADNGVSLVGVVSSLAPAAAVFFVLRRVGLGWPAAVVAALLVAASATGEAVAWGGYPQLLALGISVVFLYLIDRCLRSGKVLDAVWAGIVLAVDLATSHLIGLTAGLAGAVVVVVHMIVAPSGFRRSLGVMARTGALIALPTIPLVPLYVRLFDLRFTGQGRKLSLGQLPESVHFLYRDAPNLWWTIMALAVLTPIVLFDRRREPIWIMTSASLVACLAVFGVTGELRFVYLLPIAGALALGCWIRELELGHGFLRKVVRPAVLVALLVALGAQSVTGLRFFRIQRDFYQVLSADSLRAIEWVEERTPRDSVVAVSPSRQGWRLGTWITGVGRRRAISAGDTSWLFYEEERSETRAANRLFGDTFPTLEGLRIATEMNVDFVFVDKRWPGYSPSRWNRMRSEGSTVVVFENEAVIILQPTAGTR